MEIYSIRMQQIDYSAFIDQAMRGVVRQVLRGVQKNGLPGEHHFYITFRTTHPGVKISDTIKSRYPQEMTIVLQHQFWDFRVEDNMFYVTLSFGGVPERLEIPYAALTAFADPSVKFGLQFQMPEDAPQANDAGTPVMLFENEPSPLGETSAEEAQAAEIISLDSFRKK